MKPITPSQVGAAKHTLTPPEVIQAFNELIAMNWDGTQSVVGQEEALMRAFSIHDNDEDIETLHLDRSQYRKAAFKNGYLNLEALYESAGWRVEYDKPGYNETYPATFTFTRV